MCCHCCRRDSGVSGCHRWHSSRRRTPPGVSSGKIKPYYALRGCHLELTSPKGDFFVGGSILLRVSKERPLAGLLLHHGHERALGIGLCIQFSYFRRKIWVCTYHWFDIGMRYSVEFVEVEFVFWSDVYICAFVLRTVTVLGC